MVSRCSSDCYELLNASNLISLVIFENIFFFKYILQCLCEWFVSLCLISARRYICAQHNVTVLGILILNTALLCSHVLMLLLLLWAYLYVSCFVKHNILIFRVVFQMLHRYLQRLSACFEDTVVECFFELSSCATLFCGIILSNDNSLLKPKNGIFFNSEYTRK